MTIRRQSPSTMAFLMLSLTACGHEHESRNATAPSLLEYDSSVPSEQQDRIEMDLARLSVITITDPHLKLDRGSSALNFLGDTARMMGLESISARPLTDWLTERVHSVVGQSFEVYSGKLAQISPPNFGYENPGEFPDVEEPAPLPSPSPVSAGPEPSPIPTPDLTTSVLMSNLGTGLYRLGKSKEFLLGLEIAGRRVEISSPRTGILQIGPGFFTPESFPNSVNFDADSNSVYRLGILFHEARHSDGHGRSLGFLHAICPSGDLQGFWACDRNLNGPYTIGARMTQILAESCWLQKRCTHAEMEELRIDYLDSYSRVILETPVKNLPVATTSATRSNDPTNSKELDKLTQKLADCKILQTVPGSSEGEDSKDLMSLNTKLASLRAQLKLPAQPPTHPSEEWDASPEGKRK